MFKKFLFLILFSLLLAFPVCAEQENISSALPYTESSQCFQSYSIPSENLFYLTLAAINSNRYTLKETLTREGYILFAVGKKEFLATVVNVDSKNSLVKISPVDNSYYFSPTVVNNIFYYITTNQALDPKVLLKGK